MNKLLTLDQNKQIKRLAREMYETDRQFDVINEHISWDDQDLETKLDYQREAKKFMVTFE